MLKHNSRSYGKDTRGRWANRPSSRIVPPRTVMRYETRTATTATERAELSKLYMPAIGNFCVTPLHHEADAADAAHPRLERGERESRGDRRVDGVAAGREHTGADIGRRLILR